MPCLNVDLCDAGDDNCRGAEGRLKVYFESTGDDRIAAKRTVTTTIRSMLQESAASIAENIDEVEKLEFEYVDTNRSKILPPRKIIKSGWVIFPFVACSMLIVYGLLIIVRERSMMVYRNVDNRLFAQDNKLRSDDIDIPESLEKKQWDSVQIIYDDGDNDDAFNRESLARCEQQFQMPSTDEFEDSQMDEQVDWDTSIIRFHSK